MQIKSLGIRRLRIDDTTPPDAFERLRKIETFRELRAEGCSEAAALRAIGWSRATYYRWQARLRACGVKGLAAKSRRPRRTHPARWTRPQERAVWRMRKQYPFMGKRRLKAMLEREGTALSESAIGRILAKGARLGRVAPCAFLRGRVKAKRRRSFAQGRAQPLAPGHEGGPPRRMDPDRPHERLARRRHPQGIQGRLPGQQAARRAGLFPGHREQRQPLPQGRARRPAVRSALDPSRRRQRVLRGVRERLRSAQSPLGRPAAEKPSAQRRRRTRQRQLKNRVLEPCSGGMTVKEAGPALAGYQRFYNHVRPHCALDLMTPIEYSSPTQASRARTVSYVVNPYKGLTLPMPAVTKAS